MCAWNPQVSIGFLFLITWSMTSMSVLPPPKYVKAIKGKKTDKKDSKWIADLFKFDLVRSSFIPPKDFRQLREIARYRFKLVCMKASEKNRIQNCMTVSNIGIASAALTLKFMFTFLEHIGFHFLTSFYRNIRFEP